MDRSLNKPLPVLIHGVQHDGRIWHFKTGPLVLTPDTVVTLTAGNLELSGHGKDQDAARQDFAKAFATLWDKAMDPKRKLTLPLELARRRLLALVDNVVDNRPKMAEDAKMQADRVAGATTPVA